MSVQRSKIIAITLTLAIMLAFIGVMIATFNPFKTLPVIRVEDAYWTLRRYGYNLHLVISTTAPVQLVAVDAGGVHEVVYDIMPPKTEIDVPTTTMSDTVTLHFNVGSPVKVTVTTNTLPTHVFPVYGQTRIFLAGTLSEPSTILGVPISTTTKVLLAVPPVKEEHYKYFISLHYPDFKGVIKEVDDISWHNLSDYTTIIFADIVPEPSLLNELIKNRKAVVVHMSEKSLGEVRFDITKDGKVVVNTYSADRGDIDYLGAHCVFRKVTTDLESKLDLLSSLAKLYGLTEAHYIISPSTYCSAQVAEVYATTNTGEPVFAKLKQGFYVSSIDLKLVLVLAVTGFFEASGKRIYVEELKPFKGIRPLSMPATETLYAVSVISRFYTHVYYVSKPPVSYTVSGNTVVLEVGILNKKPILEGLHKIKIEEYTYDFDLLKVVFDAAMALPTSIRNDYVQFHAYLVYIDDSPVFVVADEYTVESKPTVAVEYSAICELFTLRVRRLDNIPSPLVLSINGKDIYVLTNEKSVYEDHRCIVGQYDVVVRDTYGNIVQRARFSAIHIYQNPLFILGVISAGMTISTFVYAIKRREKKEVDEVVMVFYRLPDIEERVFTHHSVIDAISNIFSKQKVSPTISEVIDALYRRHPILSNLNEIAKAMCDLLRSKAGRRAYDIYSRYTPELDDTVSIIGPRSRLQRDFYTIVINEVLRKFGGISELGENLKDIVDVDLVAVLGKRMLLIVYATSPSDIRSAVDRALTALIRIRRFRIPLYLVGVAVVTEPQHVKTVNDIVDRILDQDEDVASKIFRDMTMFTQLRAVPKDEWLNKFIIVAAPITRVAPLLAFAKAGATRLANKYYRLISFVREE